MTSEKWSKEDSTLFVTAANTKVVPKAVAYLVGTLALVLITDTMFVGTPIFPYAMSLSLVPGFFIIQYVVVFYSSLTKLDLVAARAAYYADKAGYKAKLAALSKSPFQPTRNQNIIAWVIIALLVIGMYSQTSH